MLWLQQGTAKMRAYPQYSTWMNGARFAWDADALAPTTTNQHKECYKDNWICFIGMERDRDAFIEQFLEHGGTGLLNTVHHVALAQLLLQCRDGKMGSGCSTALLRREWYLLLMLIHMSRYLWMDMHLCAVFAITTCYRSSMHSCFAIYCNFTSNGWYYPVNLDRPCLILFPEPCLRLHTYRVNRC